MVTSSNLSTIAILFNDCRMGALLTTEATAAYTYRTTDVILLYTLRRRKAQKQHGFRAKSTYGHCIKDEVLIDAICGREILLVNADVVERTQN